MSIKEKDLELTTPEAFITGMVIGIGVGLICALAKQTELSEIESLKGIKLDDTSQRKDYLKLQSDWRNVGRDIQTSIDKELILID